MSSSPNSHSPTNTLNGQQDTLVRKRRSVESAKTIKVAVLGVPGVGKSAIAVRFLTHRFIGEYDEFLECRQSLLSMVDMETVNFEVVDTCSRAPEGWVKEEHLRWADGLVLVYDMTQASTFLALEPVYNRAVELRRSGHLPAVIVANKRDLCHLRAVSTQEGERLASTLSCPYIEVSAAEDTTDITDAFHVLYREVRMLRRRSRTFFDRIFGTHKK